MAIHAFAGDGAHGDDSPMFVAATSNMKLLRRACTRYRAREAFREIGDLGRHQFAWAGASSSATAAPGWAPGALNSSRRAELVLVCAECLFAAVRVGLTATGAIAPVISESRTHVI